MSECWGNLVIPNYENLTDLLFQELGTLGHIKSHPMCWVILLLMAFCHKSHLFFGKQYFWCIVKISQGDWSSNFLRNQTLFHFQREKKWKRFPNPFEINVKDKQHLLRLKLLSLMFHKRCHQLELCLTIF